MDPQNFSVVSRDGFRLHGSLFSSASGTAKQVVIICPATGVPQTFYFSFAKFLAANGLVALVYDYRGIGKSRPTSLRGFPASMQHWIDDLGVITRWTHEKFPSSAILILGHSIGGVLALVNPEKRLVTHVMTVGAQLAYWRDWPLKIRYTRFLLWHLFIPIVTRLFGYFPGRRLKMGEDLPYDFALGWGQCWRTRSGLLSWMRESGSLITPSDVTVVGVSDDSIGTPHALENLHGRVIAKSIKHQWVRPKEHGLAAIGHFDIFREKVASRVWPSLLSLLAQTR